MTSRFRGQKRIYIPETAYFITAVTRDRFPYFREPLLCDIFAEGLYLCERMKGFRLYGWVLCFDHFHLLIEPNGEWNHSEILFSIKKQFSHTANRVMGFHPVFPVGAETFPRLRGDFQSFTLPVIRLSFLALRARIKFLFKHNNREPLPVFRWQKSFHDHCIRSERDFWKHLNYIAGNPDKHRLPEDWPYVFTHPKYCNRIDPA